MIRPGDIVLAILTQADGSHKLRPALAICQLPGNFGDWLVCGISSQLHQRIADWDEVLDPDTDADSQTGLHRPSIVRLSFLGVIARDAIAGGIGRINAAKHTALVARLVAHLSLRDA